jgi:hypothetical protein
VMSQTHVAGGALFTKFSFRPTRVSRSRSQ